MHFLKDKLGNVNATKLSFNWLINAANVQLMIYADLEIFDKMWILRKGILEYNIVIYYNDRNPMNDLVIQKSSVSIFCSFFFIDLIFFNVFIPFLVFWTI